MDGIALITLHLRGEQMTSPPLRKTARDAVNRQLKVGLVSGAIIASVTVADVIVSPAEGAQLGSRLHIAYGQINYTKALTMLYIVPGGMVGW